MGIGTYTFDGFVFVLVGFTMTFFKVLIVFLIYATVTHCEDCFFGLSNGKQILEFDLSSFKELRSVSITESNDVYSINIKLCANNNEQKIFCNGTIGSTICLIKNKKYVTDIGSKLKEKKLNAKDQLFMSWEGNSLCANNKKYTTDVTFICNQSIIVDIISYKQDLNRCKHIIEVTSIAACPVDDLNVRKICENSVSTPNSLYNFNLKLLRRSTNNYVVVNQNRRFEVNICGRLVDSNKCGGNITTVCDITDDMHPKIFAVGYSKNDKLTFDSESRTLKLKQYEKISKKNGKIIEFNFKCDENIPPEKTKLEFLAEENHMEKMGGNVVNFKVTTSIVCIPRKTLCEIFINNDHFNLKPLHKRVGNWIVTNANTGGRFYLNVCGFINQYDEGIPSSCTVGGKTSVCYVDKFGKGYSVGSTQIGPLYNGNLILLNYTDGLNCTNSSLKWSTLINFTCSYKSELIYDSTNIALCTHLFLWKSHEACKKIFVRNDQCMVIQPDNSRVYNMSDLKYHTFEINNNDNNVQFRFSICSPLLTPCNGYLDAAACWSVNGIEKNIGVFTEQIVFDDGKLYMSMEGEKCVNDGPNSLNSLTIIRFVCDYSDSKSIDYKVDLPECTFMFIIHTKNACTQSLTINCTVTDSSGNYFDLSQLTLFNRNYEISIDPKKTIVLNVCHNIINNDINAVNCQFTSGVCLIDSNNLLISDRYKNLGDVNKSPYVNDKNKIILEMTDGFYDGHTVSSVIEFTCSHNTNGPFLTNEKNGVYKFKWLTPLVCATESHTQNIIYIDSTISDHLTSTTKVYLTTDKEVSHILFNIGIPVMLIMLSALWFYRWKLLKEVRKIINNLRLVSCILPTFLSGGTSKCAVSNNNHEPLK